ncbi:hypothetical protein H0E87_020718, partial [Populus deltoides]
MGILLANLRILPPTTYMTHQLGLICIIDCLGVGHFDGCPRCSDELDGGLNSFPPPFFIQDMAFVYSDGVYGSSSIHLPTSPTIIDGVDFSADTIDAKIFGDLDARVIALPLLIRASGHGRVSPTQPPLVMFFLCP